VTAPLRPGRRGRRPGRGRPARRPRRGRARPDRPGGRDPARPGPAQPQAGGAAHRGRRPAGRLPEGRLERPDPASGPGRGRHAAPPGLHRPARLRRPRPAPPGDVAGPGHHHRSALPHRAWRHGHRSALPPVAVSREIAALGGIQESALADSGWWAGLRARLARSARPWPPGPRGRRAAPVPRAVGERGHPRHRPGAAGGPARDPAGLRHLARRLGAVEPALGPGAATGVGLGAQRRRRAPRLRSAPLRLPDRPPGAGPATGGGPRGRPRPGGAAPGRARPAARGGGAPVRPVPARAALSGRRGRDVGGHRPARGGRAALLGVLGRRLATAGTR
jgi:translation initiation factor IF-2